MSDLTEFLLARIDDDEAVARAADAPYFLYDLESKAGEQYDHIARHDPARVLAQCAALRAVVEIASPAHDEQGREIPGSGIPDILRALAKPYADHPDYPLED